MLFLFHNAPKILAIEPIDDVRTQTIDSISSTIRISGADTPKQFEHHPSFKGAAANQLMRYALYSELTQVVGAAALNMVDLDSAIESTSMHKEFESFSRILAPFLESEVNFHDERLMKAFSGITVTHMLEKLPDAAATVGNDGRDRRPMQQQILVSSKTVRDILDRATGIDNIDVHDIRFGASRIDGFVLNQTAIEMDELPNNVAYAIRISAITWHQSTTAATETGYAEIVLELVDGVWKKSTRLR